MMDQMENARLAALGPQARALREVAQAREFLNHGLLLEAERLLLKAMAGNPRQPEAHAALAEVRERAGDAAAARQEATTSLELLPSVDAYMVLARLDVARTSWDLASREVNAALQIDGQNQAARDLKQQIEAGKAAIR